MERPSRALRHDARAVTAACLGLLLLTAQPALAAENSTANGGQSGSVTGSMLLGRTSAQDGAATPAPSSVASGFAAAVGSAASGASSASAKTPASASSYTYTVDNAGGAVITGFADAATAPAQMTIPATIDGYQVVGVGPAAFQGATQLVSVTLPKSVVSIGDYAFADCPNLTTVALNEGLSQLGAGAFLNDAKLAEIAIPSTLTGCGMVWSGTQGTGPFGGCLGLTTVTLADGLAAVPAYLLMGCTAPELEVVVPATVTSFGTDSLSTANAPAGVTLVAFPGTFAQSYAEQNGFGYRDPSVHATSVSLATGTLSLKNGTSQKLAATIAPLDATDPIEWSSSNPAVARVDANGTVTAVKAGTATITVQVSGLSASCEVTVWQPVTSIDLNRQAFSVEAAEGRQLVPTVLPADATNKTVIWSSSNPAVASVNAQTGAVTAVAEGTCTITATAADGAGATRSCTVTVTSNSYTVTQVSELASPHPYANNCADAWVYTVPGAQVIKVSFDQRTVAENTFDFIEVYDGAGNLVGTYTGSELAGATLTLSGDTVRIKLDTDDEVNAWGFAVASVEAVQPSGWIVIGGLTYYYVDGSPCYGERWIDGACYYFDPRSGAMVTGFVRLPGGAIRYYDHRGVMVTGDVTINNQRYSFNSDGDLVVDNSTNIEVNVNNTTINNNTIIDIDQNITVQPGPEPSDPNEPTEPEEPPVWNLSVTEGGHITTDYFTCDLPAAWVSKVQVVMEGEGSTAVCAIQLLDHPELVLARFRVAPVASLDQSRGDAASYLGASWDNGNNQAVELWATNWAELARAGGSALPADDLLSLLVSLSTGGAVTLDEARAAADVTALPGVFYAVDSLVPTVRVPVYDADGEQTGEAQPQVYVGTLANVEKPAEPEEPSDAEQPTEPEAPAGDEQPGELETPGEPEAPAADTQPADAEQPAEPEGVAAPVSDEQPADAEQPAESEAPADAETPSGDEQPAAPETPVGDEQLAESEQPADAEQPSEPETPAGDGQSTGDEQSTEPEQPSDSEAPAKPETPAGDEQPAELAPVPQLSLFDQDTYLQLNQLLTAFAAGYEGARYSETQPSATQDEQVALMGVAYVVRSQALPQLPSDQRVVVEPVEGGANPWGDPVFDARIPAEPALQAAWSLTGVTLEEAALTQGTLVRFADGYAYYNSEAVKTAQSGIVLADTLDPTDETTYSVTFSEFGGPAYAQGDVPVDVTNEDYLGLYGSDLAQRLSVDGSSPREGRATIRLVPAGEPAEDLGGAENLPAWQGIVIDGYRLVIVDFSLEYPAGYVPPMPEPAPEPEPEPVAEPQTAPEPEPEPQPEVAPAPEVQEPIEPAPAPEPEPVPDDIPDEAWTPDELPATDSLLDEAASAALAEALEMASEA